MILHQDFVKVAKKFSKKMAMIDRTRDSKVPYSKALIASLILSKKFQKYEEQYIGVMISDFCRLLFNCNRIVDDRKSPCDD